MSCVKSIGDHGEIPGRSLADRQTDRRSAQCLWCACVHEFRCCFPSTSSADGLDSGVYDQEASLSSTSKSHGHVNLEQGLSAGTGLTGGTACPFWPGRTLLSLGGWGRGVELIAVEMKAWNTVFSHSF